MSGRRGKKQWFGGRIFQRSVKEIKTSNATTEKEVSGNDENKAEDLDSSLRNKQRSTRASACGQKREPSPRKRPHVGRGNRNGSRPCHTGLRHPRASSSIGKGRSQDITNTDNETRDVTGKSETSNTLVKGKHTVKDRSLDEDWSKELIDIPMRKDTSSDNEICENTKSNMKSVWSEHCETPGDVKDFLKECEANNAARSTHIWPLQSTPVKDKTQSQNTGKAIEKGRVNQDGHKVLPLGIEDSSIIDVGGISKQDGKGKIQGEESKPLVTDNDQNNTNKVKQEQKCEQQNLEPPRTTETSLKDKNLVSHKYELNVKSQEPAFVNKSRNIEFGQGPRSHSTRAAAQPFRAAKLDTRNRGSWNPSRYRDRTAFSRGFTRPRSVETFNGRNIPPRFSVERDRRLKPTDVHREPRRSQYMLSGGNRTRDKKMDTIEPAWVLPASEDWGSDTDEEEIVLDKDGEDYKLPLQKNDIHDTECVPELDAIVENVNKKVTKGAESENIKHAVLDTVVVKQERYLPPPPPVSEGNLDETQEDISIEEDPLDCALNQNELNVRTLTKPEMMVKDFLENDLDSPSYSESGLYVCDPDLSEIELMDSGPISQENIEIDCCRLSQDQEVPKPPKNSHGHNVPFRSDACPRSGFEINIGNREKDNKACPSHDYCKDSLYSDWNRIQMQNYFSWLNYQWPYHSPICPEEPKSIDYSRQDGVPLWHDIEYPHPYTQAAEMERQEKAHQEQQRISDYWQDRMPNWVESQEATVQTSPNLSQVLNKDQSSVKNKIVSDKRTDCNLVKTDKKDLNLSTELTTRNLDIQKEKQKEKILRGEKSSYVKNYFTQETKSEPQKFISESTPSISPRYPAAVNDKGTCSCKNEEVKYLLWRMCNCPAGNPPTLQRIFHHGQEEITQDLGYHSVDSVGKENDIATIYCDK